MDKKLEIFKQYIKKQTGENPVIEERLELLGANINQICMVCDIEASFTMNTYIILDNDELRKAIDKGVEYEMTNYFDYDKVEDYIDKELIINIFAEDEINCTTMSNDEIDRIYNQTINEHINNFDEDDLHQTIKTVMGGIDKYQIVSDIIANKYTSDTSDIDMYIPYREYNQIITENNEIFHIFVLQ